MRYPLLASALTLLFGTSVALADDNANPQTSDTSMDQSKSQTQTQTQTKTKTQTQAKQGAAMEHQNVQNVDLFFDTDSAELAATAGTDLQQLADWAKCDQRNAIILEGHADPRGTQNHNLKLSGERAGTVRQRLIDLGVPSRRIVVTVYGENGPRKPSFQQERRVTARAAETPIAPADLPT